MKNLFKNFGLDNKKVFLIILACLIIFLDFTFLLKNQLLSLKGLKPQVLKLKADLDTLSVNLNKMQELKDKRVGAKHEAALSVKKIIYEEQLTLLLQNISDTANRSDVRILQIKPSKGLPGKDSGMAKFTPLLISLDLLCDYHSLGRFINALENTQVFIAVQSIRIAPQQKDYLKERVNLVLRTYINK